MRALTATLAFVLLSGGSAWMPLEVGRTWTYLKSRDGKDSKEVTIAVKEVRGDKDKPRLLVEGRLFADDSSFQTCLYWTDDKGLWMRRTEKKAPEDEALLILKFPVEKGTWEVPIRKFEGKDWTFAFENHGEEKVTVPAGDFDAVKISCTPEKGVLIEFWYAKDAGIVRRRMTEGKRTEELLELKATAKPEGVSK